MFSSLRSRLWLTYLLIVISVLVVVTASLLFYLARNPRLSREAESNLSLAASSINRLNFTARNLEELERLVLDADQALNTRVLVFNAQGIVLADSRAQSEASFSNIPFSGQQHNQRDLSNFQDEDGQEWFFIRRNIQGRNTLVLATQRPAAPLLSLFTDEFFRPLMQAGLLALFLSLLLAYLMARWIAGPLQGILLASQGVAQGEMTQIEPSGPQEVRNLSRAFNEMSRQVDASRKAQQDFVANVSHDLKTPLTSIHGFGQAILDGTAKSGQKLKHAAKVIVSEADHMTRLVEELLDSARFESGIVKIEFGPIKISALLKDLVERFSLKAKKAEVNLELKLQEIPEIQGDADRLNQALSNLIENALKHTPREGTIQIAAQSIATNVEISISDTGAGIPQDELPRIFERFYQVDKVRPEGKGRGSGLGLSIARQIIEAHHGSIRVESIEGQGSRFIVALPLS